MMLFLRSPRTAALVVSLLLFAGSAGTATAFAPPLRLQMAPRTYLASFPAARRPAPKRARAVSPRMVILGGDTPPGAGDIHFDSYSYELDGGKPLVVGLAGGTGSGKSTMMDVILRELVPNGGAAANEVAILSHDNYYLHRADLSDEERERINFDHPDSLETDLMVEHLKQLLKGNAVDCPVYDFATHLRKEHETIRVEPRPIILVEGILIFTNKALRDMMNLKIYVDVEADRRILRSKAHADLIVPHGARNVAAIQVLLERFRAHLRATRESPTEHD